MVKAKALKKGDTVALIAPAGPVDIGRLRMAREKTEEMGFRVMEGRNIRRVHGYLAGRDEERLADLHAAFHHDGVDGIFCLRGGYGTTRFALSVCVDLIRANPKVFAGYSDITALHLVFNQQAGLITFHAPMPAVNFTSACSDFTIAGMIDAITLTELPRKLCNPEREAMYTLSGGCARGRVCGGNLSLIAQSMGTPYEIDTADRILFIEDVGEAPYRIDGMLTMLKNAGKLNDCAGVLIGDLSEPENPPAGPALAMADMLREVLTPLGKPVLANFRSGHCEPMISLPLGVMMEMDADNRVVTLLENGCR